MNFISNLTISNKFKKAEKEIGYKLVFNDIPDIWINGLMELDMTNTWKKFGLDVERGVNHFTMGKVKNGISSRFIPGEPQYQSWLGGYMVKLKEGANWVPEDHLNLAVADQKSWLKRYGDPNPVCDLVLEESQVIGPIKIGEHSGLLGHACFISHSDVGKDSNSTLVKVSTAVMAEVFNVYNPALKLSGKMLRPQNSGKSYETLKLKGYMAVFGIDKDVKVVLYGTGITAFGESNVDTFETIKDEILNAFKACRIVKI